MTTVAVVDMPGKYQVLFDGLMVPCFNDTQCPGAGICAINQTWATQPGGWCMCNSRAGLDGNECSEICPLGSARLGIGICVMTLSLGMLVIGVLALRWSTKRRVGVSDNLNVLNMLLVSVTFGSLLMFVYLIMLFVSTLDFPYNYIVAIVGGREMRRTPQQVDYATFILLVLQQCISVNAPLVLPLLWIDLTNTVFKFRKRSVNTIKFFTSAFCCLVCFVQFPLYVLAANNYQGQIKHWGEIAATIWYVVYGFLIFMNLVAAGNVLSVRREILSRPQTETTQRFVVLLNRVFITACMLAVCFAALIGLIYGAQLRQERTLYNDPTCNVINGSSYTLSDLCLRLALVFLELINAICLWFILPDTRKLMWSTPRPTNEQQMMQEKAKGDYNSEAPQLQRDLHITNDAGVQDVFKSDSQSGFGPDNKQDIMVI